MTAQTESYLPRRKRAFGLRATFFEGDRQAQHAMLAVELADLRAARPALSRPAYEARLKRWTDRAKLRAFSLRDFHEESN